MIKEAYVSFEVAKLLKEKGFHEPCIATYNSTTKNFQVEEVYQDWTIHWKGYISASTQQMAMRWLREIYNIDIIIFHEKLPNDCYWTRIERNLLTEFQQEPVYKSYEDAVEAALKYTLNNLI